MTAAFEQILILLSFMFLGFFFGKKGLADNRHGKILSVLCVYLFLPCTIFNSFSSHFTVANIRQYAPLVSVSFIIVLLTIVCGWLLSGLLTEKKSYERLILLYTIAAPNYGHVGYAMAESLYGGEGLLHLVMFSLPISLFTYTLGFSTLTKRPLNAKKLLNPVLCAFLAGILFGLTGLKLPGVATQFLTKAAGCMSPTGMLLAGLTISEFDFKKMIPSRNAWIMCAMRLLVIPISVTLILKGLTDNVILIRTASLVFSMPCGLNTIQFPKLVGEDCRLGAQLCLTSNLLAAITIPLCLTLV